jgi:hypothetical protein
LEPEWELDYFSKKPYAKSNSPVLFMCIKMGTTIGRQEFENKAFEKKE